MRPLTWNWPVSSSRALGRRLWGQNPKPLGLTHLAWTGCSRADSLLTGGKKPSPGGTKTNCRASSTGEQCIFFQPY